MTAAGFAPPTYVCNNSTTRWSKLGVWLAIGFPTFNRSPSTITMVHECPVHRRRDVLQARQKTARCRTYLSRLAEMSSVRTRRPLPGLALALALAPGASFEREVESRNGREAGADAEWLSGASVFET